MSDILSDNPVQVLADQHTARIRVGAQTCGALLDYKAGLNTRSSTRAAL